jgi:LEA14-like dessication related protein
VRITACSLLLVATAACGGGGTISPDNFIPPSVRVDHLSVKNAGLMGGTMDVVMAIYNPNRATIKGNRLQGGLDIENTHVGDVDFIKEFKLKDRDTTMVTVPMQFKWSGAGAAAKSVLGYGTVNYKMNGTVNVDTPDGKPFQVPFTGQGSAAVLRP